MLWWGAWVLVCIPAGAVAGIGLVEFNWGGPPYDGGFLGHLILFGGFLAFVQSPFVAAFVCSVSGEEDESRWGAAALSRMAAWTSMGLFGWLLGSLTSTLSPMPVAVSYGYVVNESLPWMGAGIFEALVLVGMLAPAPSPRGRWLLLARLLGAYAAWVAASALGGILVEWFVAHEVADGLQGHARPTITEVWSSRLEGFGVAENVARVIIPYALVITALYGPPTGLALLVARRIVGRHVSA